MSNSGSGTGRAVGPHEDGPAGSGQRRGAQTPPLPVSAQPPLPAGAVDCHLHVFPAGDAARLVAARAYDPWACELADYRRAQRALGATRAVLVQPSVYGTDNDALLRALSSDSDGLRGVVVAGDDVDAEQLSEWHEVGVRAVRLNLTQPGGVDAAEVRRLAPRLRALGWHVQVVSRAGMLVEHMGWLEDTGCPIVVDHFGLPDTAAGPTSPSFIALVDRLRGGQWWVKLSGHYRTAPDPADLLPFAHVLLEANPQRLVWGSDWPHPDHYACMPTLADLADALRLWTADAPTLRRVAVDNAETLYGFAST